MSGPRCLDCDRAVDLFCRACRGDGDRCCQCNVRAADRRQAQRASEWACRAFAAGLLGVCWGMAADVCMCPLGWRDRVGSTLVREWLLAEQVFTWLLDQSRPSGCRAPWEPA
jgi:hypothetical protein